VPVETFIVLVGDVGFITELELEKTSTTEKKAKQPCTT
jgi:hypothetical protein